MKYFYNLIVGVVLGVMGTLFYQSKQKTDDKVAVLSMQNTIENLRKLVVVKETYSKTYTFKDTKKYMYDFFEFDKKTVLLVNASLEAGFDMKNLKVEIDSVNHLLKIKEIPEVELNFNPQVKYLDLEQNAFNEFDAKELNKVKEKAVSLLRKDIHEEALKEKARLRLLEELDELYVLAKALNWKVEISDDLKIQEDSNKEIKLD